MENAWLNIQKEEHKNYLNSSKFSASSNQNNAKESMLCIRPSHLFTNRKNREFQTGSSGFYLIFLQTISTKYKYSKETEWSRK